MVKILQLLGYDFHAIQIISEIEYFNCQCTHHLGQNLKKDIAV